MPFTFNLICQECLISVMLRIFVDCACYSTLDVLTLFKDTFISSLDYCSVFTHLSASTLGFPVSVQQNKWVKSLLFWGRVSSSLGQHQAPYVAQYNNSLELLILLFPPGIAEYASEPRLIQESNKPRASCDQGRLPTEYIPSQKFESNLVIQNGRRYLQNIYLIRG